MISTIALALLCFEQLVLVLISLIRCGQSRKPILDLDLWFKPLQSAAMFPLFCFTDRVNAEGQAVLIDRFAAVNRET